MLELSGFKPLFDALGGIYWLALIASVGYALWKPRSILRKLMVLSLVLAIFILPAAPSLLHSYEYKRKFARAKALFEERCKSAGDQIFRRVDNVDGVYLLYVRGTEPRSMEDPLWVDAAVPHEPGGDDYVRTFLFWEHHNDVRSSRGPLRETPEGATAAGYSFVDLKKSDGSLVRHRLAAPGRGDLVRKVIKQPTRYGVDVENDLNPVDREHWIAGTTVSVIDTLTGEVLGKSVVYSFEPGFGSTHNARLPWWHAKTCPDRSGLSAHARYFVDIILGTRQIRP